MTEELKVGDWVEITEEVEDSCGEQIGDRGIVMEIAGNKVLMYHVTMEREQGWSYLHRRGGKAQERIKMGLITEEEARSKNFWWYWQDVITKVNRQQPIKWID